jgi:endonuclease YncB( thermonuclease family)
MAMALAVVSPALADAVAVDGDTIRLDGMTYRLWGIDSPEARHSCGDGWPPGAHATASLRDMLRGHTVTCEPKTIDRYGRTVALCRADGVDIGGAMVRAGQAWAFIRYSQDYVRQDAEARADRAGVHGHDCLPAWDWWALRRGQSE